MATMTMSELEMATATASSRQLKTPGEGLLTQRENPFTTTESSPEGSIKDDPVLEASRLADLEAPDGGRGWVVVAGCAILTYWFMGTSYSWGVIQNALVEDDVGSAASLSFVGSVATAMVSAMALITAKISGLLGSRYTCMIGVVMLGLGEILAGLTTHAVGGLFATAGVVFGTASVAPAQWFSKKRGLANGIVFAAGGLGGAVTSLAMNSLVEAVGPAWTFRILGFLIIGIGLPAAWLVQERRKVPNRFLDWSLFRNINFVLLFAGGAIGSFPLLVPPFFIPLYSRSIGLESRTGAYLVAGFNFASAIGRISSGLLSDRIGAVNALFSALTLNALTILVLWPFATSIGTLVAFVIINGMSSGAFFSAMPTTVGNIFGSTRVAAAMGFIVTGWVGGFMMGAPIAGYMLDAFGGRQAGSKPYRPAIFWAGAMALTAAILIGAMRVRLSRKLMVKV
ncbi:major facilitator superfamily domain-containing protein [Ilyonectria robusta]|uniref:major facilitator superfamily domain-containing protein n=1 Tax=Ilyonectria robusta TaxID=1079257 RepID=UPI001E8D93C3|nr:major facilitator superfamily domain-containing protein [Ilyonectria robusta]KAH8666156.1 major facilitator superfamily domain-containing protein [Ilyonectria robusta]